MEVSPDDVGKFHVLDVSKSGVETWVHRKRRAHRKTPTGCSACKLKSVKCDESKPVCQRCIRNGRICIFPNLFGMSMNIDRHTSLPILSNSCVISNIDVSDLPTLRYLLRYWEEILCLPQVEGLVDLCRSDIAITNTLLALAASHRRCMSPRSTQYQYLEYHYKSVALREYQKLLDKPMSISSQAEVDTLLVDAVLISMLTFILPEEDSMPNQQPEPFQSWVFSVQTNRLGWLVVQSGLFQVLRCKALNLPKAIDYLSKLFPTPFNQEIHLDDHARMKANVPGTWLKLFDSEVCARSTITYGSTTDIYEPLVKQVRELECRTPPPRQGISTIFVFLGKITTEIRERLYQRDELTLCLFGYWLGLVLRSSTQWWYESRARQDFAAIQSWFEMIKSNYCETLWTKVARDLAVLSACTPLSSLQ